MPEIHEMIGKEVEVLANGMTYRGRLMEVSDSEVHIKTLLQWMSLPIFTVSAIKPVDQSAREPEREGLFSNNSGDI